MNEKTLERLGDTDFEKIYLYPNSHAGYYPGARPIAMKVLFRRSDGRVLGAQAVGDDGVDKRISELALAIQLGATVYDLRHVRSVLRDGPVGRSRGAAKSLLGSGAVSARVRHRLGRDAVGRVGQARLTEALLPLRPCGGFVDWPHGVGKHAIEVDGLVREFKKGPRAVDGIDLFVDHGEIYGFLGPNGAGKSTTVLMLTTLLPPTAGTARVGGFDVATQGPEVRKVIGAALQEAALDPLLTGREHLRLQATLQALPRESRRRRADELLDRVGPDRGRRPQGEDATRAA